MRCDTMNLAFWIPSGGLKRCVISERIMTLVHCKYWMRVFSIFSILDSQAEENAIEIIRHRMIRCVRQHICVLTNSGSSREFAPARCSPARSKPFCAWVATKCFPGSCIFPCDSPPPRSALLWASCPGHLNIIMIHNVTLESSSCMIKMEERRKQQWLFDS